HGRIDPIVIGGCSENEMAAAERFRDQGRYMGAGNIVGGDVFDTSFCQAGSQDIDNVFRVSVHGGIKNRNRPIFRFISAPEIVFLQKVVEIFSTDDAVKRADSADGEGRQLLQGSLYLGTIFSDDVAVVPSGIGEPVTVKIHL